MGNEKKENEIIDELKSENNPFAQDVNNNQEEMSCLKLITDRNNTNKKFHKYKISEFIGITRFLSSEIVK